MILEPGLYYVYSQLSFLEVFDNPGETDTGSQSLSHYIYRYVVYFFTINPILSEYHPAFVCVCLVKFILMYFSVWNKHF